MELILFSLFFISSSFAQGGWEAPEILENACYENSCTPQMQEIYDQFLSNPKAPEYIPGMYSGFCYHQGQVLDQNTKHYIGLLFDRFNSQNAFYMAPILQFFGEDNHMKDWTLDQARSEISPEWKNYGPMKVHPTSATQFVLDSEGYPVYVYWARQNLKTQVLYFLALSRGLSLAFCEARPNTSGLE